MPKPKGSPKTGGRKPINGEQRVLFQCRCSPEKKEYLKEKSIEYDKTITEYWSN